MAKYSMICILLFLYFIDAQTSPEFGPFNLAISGFKVCRGPKRRNCSIYSGRAINGTHMKYELNVLEDVHNIEAKLVATSDKNHKWKIPMHICDHIFWRLFFEHYVNFKNCVLKKGKYVMDVNILDVAERYYSGSFFYGKWSVKAKFYNNLCNLSCSVTDFILTPK